MPPKKRPRQAETCTTLKADHKNTEENSKDQQRQSVAQRSHNWKHAERQLLKLATNAARMAKDRTSHQFVTQADKCAKTKESRVHSSEALSFDPESQQDKAKRKHSALPHPSTPATIVNNKRTVATFSSVDGPASSANSTEKTRPPSQRGPLTLLTIKSEPEDEEQPVQDATELEVKFEPGEDSATGSSCDGERPPMPLVKIEADWEDEVAPPSVPRGTAPLVPQVKVETEDEEEVTDASSAEEQAPDRTDNDPVPRYKVLWELSLDKESESEEDEAEEEEENLMTSAESASRNSNIHELNQVTHGHFQPTKSWCLANRGCGEKGQSQTPPSATKNRDNNSEGEGWMEVVSGSMDSTNIPSFSQLTGMQVPIPGSAAPKDFFELFVDEEMVELFVTETNRYADQVKSIMPDFFYLKKWEKTDHVEMRKFIALLIAMGIFEKAEIRQYWSTHPVLETPFFRKVMPRDRFLSLMTFWHLNDNTQMPARGDSSYDKIFKVRKLYNHLDDRFRHVYYPEQNLSVAECVMPCKDGSASCQPFVSNTQRAQSGEKIYFCCESGSSYICTMKLCPDLERAGGSMDSLDSDIVEEVAGDYVSRGHIAYGVEKFEVNLNVAAFSRRPMKWWKRAATFLLHVAKVQAYALYKKVQNPNVSLLDFTLDLVLGLTNGLGTCPVNSPPPPLSDHSTNNGPAMTSQASLLPAPQQPPSAHPRLGPATVPMEFERLEYPQYDHFLEVIPQTGKTPKPTKNCVCCTLWCKKQKSYLRRRSTRYQCGKCKVALCIEPCHRLFHTVKDYKKELGHSCEIHDGEVPEDAVYALTVKVI